MEKERVWIFAIVVAFTVGVCVMLRYQYMKTGTIAMSQKDTEQTTESALEKEDILSEESKAFFQKASHVTIEKVERTVVEDAEGNSTTSYDTYYVSDVDLVDQTDETENYKDALATDEFDESLIETVEFKEAFHVDYKNSDGWTIYQSLLQENGIDGNLNEVSFDEETNKLTGQKLYELKQHCMILDLMIENTDYDELLVQKVFFQSMETEDNVTVPDYFSAVVQYTKDKKLITKSIYLQVSVNMWEEE